MIAKIGKRALWALAGMPFGALAGGFCGMLLGGFLAEGTGLIDEATSFRHTNDWWYWRAAVGGAVIGALSFAVLWGRNLGPPGRRSS